MQTASGVSGSHHFKRSQLIQGQALAVCKLGPDPPSTSLRLGLLTRPVEGHPRPAGPMGAGMKEGLASADPGAPSTLMVSPSDRAEGGLQSPPDFTLLSLGVVVGRSPVFNLAWV